MADVSRSSSQLFLAYEVRGALGVERGGRTALLGAGQGGRHFEQGEDHWAGGSPNPTVDWTLSGAIFTTCLIHPKLFLTIT